MKPMVLFAIAAAGLVGTSTMAGERPMSFDGVGAMVLDMADEPVEATYEPHSDAQAEECDAGNKAIEAEVASLYEDIGATFAMSSNALADIDTVKLATVGDAIAVEVAELPLHFSFAYAENVAVGETARKEAISRAQASIQASRDELKLRIDNLNNAHSRIALKRAEKALRIAQEALIQ